MLERRPELAVRFGDPPCVESDARGINDDDSAADDANFWVVLQKLTLALESITNRDVVRIHARDVVRGTQRQGGIHGVNKSRIGLAVHSDPRISRLKVLQDLRGRIS